MKRTRYRPGQNLPTKRAPPWKPSGVYGPPKLLELPVQACEVAGCEAPGFDGPLCIEHAELTPSHKSNGGPAEGD